MLRVGVVFLEVVVTFGIFGVIDANIENSFLRQGFDGGQKEPEFFLPAFVRNSIGDLFYPLHIPCFF